MSPEKLLPESQRYMPEQERVGERVDEFIDSINAQHESLYYPERPELSVDAASSVLATADNHSHKVYSELHTVLRVGDSMFGVLSTRLDSVDAEPTYVVSKLEPDGTRSKRPKIVGTIPSDETPFQFGRLHQDDLDASASREHGKIRLQGSELLVRDTSKNGTEVILQPESDYKASDTYSSERLSLRGLKKLLRRGDNNPPSPQRQDNPLDSIYTWAPPSSDLRLHILQETRQASQGSNGESASEQNKAEALSNNAELWQGLAELASPRGASLVQSTYQERLATPEMKAIAEKKKHMTELNKRINERSAIEPDWRLDKIDSDRIRYIQTEIARDYGEDAEKQYDQLAWLHKQTKESGHPYLDAHESKETLVRMLHEARNHDATNYARIFSTAGQEKRVQALRNHTDKKIDLEIASTDEAVDIPLGMFASATGLVSWKEGRGESQLKNGQESRAEIERNAEKPSATAPPVEQAAAFILPDGTMFVHAENSHRVASAIRRGDPYIKFKGAMTVYVLDNVPAVLQPDGV